MNTWHVTKYKSHQDLSEWLWDSPSLLSNGYQGLFPWG